MAEQKVESITERRRGDRRNGFPHVEIVNDIGIILRLQGSQFKSVEIYEPPTADLSMYRESITTAVQLRAAEILGRHAAKCIRTWVDSRLDLRVRKDKILTFAWSGFGNQLRDETEPDIRFGAAWHSLDTGVIRRLRSTA